MNLVTNQSAIQHIQQPAAGETKASSSDLKNDSVGKLSTPSSTNPNETNKPTTRNMLSALFTTIKKLFSSGPSSINTIDAKNPQKSLEPLLKEAHNSLEPLLKKAHTAFYAEKIRRKAGETEGQSKEMAIKTIEQIKKTLEATVTNPRSNTTLLDEVIDKTSGTTARQELDEMLNQLDPGRVTNKDWNKTMDPIDLYTGARDCFEIAKSNSDPKIRGKAMQAVETIKACLEGQYAEEKERIANTPSNKSPSEVDQDHLTGIGLAINKIKTDFTQEKLNNSGTNFVDQHIDSKFGKQAIKDSGHIVYDDPKNERIL